VILRVFVSSWWIGPGPYHEDAKTQRSAKFLVALGCSVFGVQALACPDAVRPEGWTPNLPRSGWRFCLKKAQRCCEEASKAPMPGRLA